MADQDPIAILEALYANQPWGKAGGGAQSGFADRDYWLQHPSEILNGRLGADLAGSGPDQPTGTPGTGVWSGSGKDRQGILTPSGMPSGSWPMPGAGVQSGLLDKSLQTLTPGMQVGGPEVPQARPDATTGVDQIMGNYDDILRQQILNQMKAD